MNEFYIVGIATESWDDDVCEAVWSRRFLQSETGDTAVVRCADQLQRLVREEVERMGYKGFDMEEFVLFGSAECTDDEGRTVEFTAYKVAPFKNYDFM